MPFYDNLLENPIWNALSTEHSALALENRSARRYPASIGPLSGVKDFSQNSLNDLHALTDAEGQAVLFCPQPPASYTGWRPLKQGIQLDQMICPEPVEFILPSLPESAELRELTSEDVTAMCELAQLTEPGPFERKTHELGVFYGIFESGRLSAMAGQRMQVPGFCEVSAVCTHPEARGRGYARIVMAKVIEKIQSEGKAPFLHVLPQNKAAICAYARLGFVRNITFHLAVLKKEA